MVKVYPVIHFESVQQSLFNASIAFHADCPGVFLISMKGEDDALCEAIKAVRDEYQTRGLKIGANFLTMGPVEALDRCLRLGLDAVWTDKPGVSSFGPNEEALLIPEMLATRPNFKFFGSVAFKYQEEEKFPAVAAKNAAGLGMIATTSGTRTGTAPDIDKILLMKDALWPYEELALASGISPENASLFLPYVDYFLVSTKISEHDDSPLLSEEKLGRLMRVVHGEG